jgi:hypothetical protein
LITSPGQYKYGKVYLLTALIFVYANCSLKIQTSNIGLKRQWLEVWQPAEDGQEAAFIFEDDMEVIFLPRLCTQRAFRQSAVN